MHARIKRWNGVS